MNSLLLSGGIFISTYIINALVAPIYSNNCVKILNYNSPPCIFALGTLSFASYINYWIFYITCLAATSAILLKFRK